MVTTPGLNLYPHTTVIAITVKPAATVSLMLSTGHLHNVQSKALTEAQPGCTGGHHTSLPGPTLAFRHSVCVKLSFCVIYVCKPSHMCQVRVLCQTSLAVFTALIGSIVDILQNPCAVCCPPVPSPSEMSVSPLQTSRILCSAALNAEAKAALLFAERVTVNTITKIHVGQSCQQACQL